MNLRKILRFIYSAHHLIEHRLQLVVRADGTLVERTPTGRLGVLTLPHRAELVVDEARVDGFADRLLHPVEKLPRRIDGEAG